jgi:hypothetical protein
MKKESLDLHCYQPLMAGLFAGIVATTLNIFYDVIFRQSTGFSLPELINVTTIIFATLFILVMSGVVFAILDRLTRYVQVIYIIIFSLATIACTYLALHTHRSADPVLTVEFRYLLMGIVIISGLLATFLIPYLAKHENGII